MALDILDLNRLEIDQDFEADLLIIGGGPAGLSIAREFFQHRLRVIVLESGQLQEQPSLSALNMVESIGEPKEELQILRRSVE